MITCLTLLSQENQQRVLQFLSNQYHIKRCVCSGVTQWVKGNKKEKFSWWGKFDTANLLELLVGFFVLFMGCANTHSKLAKLSFWNTNRPPDRNFKLYFRYRCIMMLLLVYLKCILLITIVYHPSREEYFTTKFKKMNLGPTCYKISCLFAPQDSKNLNFLILFHFSF